MQQHCAQAVKQKVGGCVTQVLGRVLCCTWAPVLALKSNRARSPSQTKRGPSLLSHDSSQGQIQPAKQSREFNCYCEAASGLVPSVWSINDDSTLALSDPHLQREKIDLLPDFDDIKNRGRASHFDIFLQAHCWLCVIETSRDAGGHRLHFSNSSYSYRRSTNKSESRLPDKVAIRFAISVWTSWDQDAVSWCTLQSSSVLVQNDRHVRTASASSSRIS